jgi:hypothetical protein
MDTDEQPDAPVEEASDQAASDAAADPAPSPSDDVTVTEQAPPLADAEAAPSASMMLEAMAAGSPMIPLSQFTGLYCGGIGVETVAVFAHLEAARGTLYDTVDNYRGRLAGVLSQEA